MRRRVSSLERSLAAPPAIGIDAWLVAVGLLSGFGVAWAGLRGFLRRSVVSAIVFLLRFACDCEGSKLGCAVLAP